MKRIVYLVFVISLFAISAVAQKGTQEENTTPTPTASVTVWDITYSIEPLTVTRQIRFVQYPNNTGAFVTGNIVPTTASSLRSGSRALWDMPQPSFLSFSGEVRLPVGNTTETGTLVFKAINGNTGTLSGQVIFLQNNAGPLTTSGNLYIIRTGTFTAVQVPIVPPTPTATEGEKTDQ
jgi:hypothetical protein